MRTKARLNKYAAGIVLLIFCAFQYGIQKICGFTLYPDEFGYWASAAQMAGYDWTEAASIGSYYSFGYSLLLFPILKCFGGGTAAYRAALFLNMLLMCAGLFLTVKILEKLFPDIGRETIFLIGGTAVLYPAWIFYMQMTMTEAVLFFMFLLDVYLFLRFMEGQELRFAILLAISLAYGYCVHMRTVATVIAGVLTLILWGIFGTGKKRRLIAGAAVLLIAGALAWWLKERTIAGTFALAEKETLAGNDYSGQIGKLQAVLTASGMLQLLKSAAGKLYYLCVASFGTFCWGLGWCAGQCVSLVRNRLKGKDTTPAQWTALFLLLAAMGQVAVCSIYMGTAPVDSLVYGRYDELLVPALMAVGIAAMMRSRYLIRITALIGAVLGGTAVLLAHETAGMVMSGIRGYHTIGIGYLLRERDMDGSVFLLEAWALGMLLTSLVCLCVWLSRRYGNARWLLSVILAMEIAAGMQLSYCYIYPDNVAFFQNRVIVEKIEEEADAESEIWYLDEGKQFSVGFLQMQLPDRTIHVVRPEELKQRDVSKDIVITSARTEQSGMLEEVFERKLASSLFHMYYN